MAKNSVLGISMFRRGFLFEGDTGGGTGGTVLASTGGEPAAEPTLLEQAGLQIGEGGKLEPAVAAPLEKPQTKQLTVAAPVVVKVGTEDLTPAQVEAEITAGRQALATLDAKKDQLAIGETFALMTPEERRIMIQTAEMLRKGENPLEGTGSTLMISPINVPEMTEAPEAPKWSEMSDTERYFYAMGAGIREEMLGKIVELTGIISGMQQYLGQLHNVNQDVKTAQALELQGITGMTAEKVAEMRAHGISDPAKAFVFLKSQGATVTTTAAPKVEDAPPEAPAGDAPKVFDANQVRPESIGWYIANGYEFSDPADAKRWEELKQRTA